MALLKVVNGEGKKGVGGALARSKVDVGKVGFSPSSFLSFRLSRDSVLDSSFFDLIVLLVKCRHRQRRRIR